MISDMATGTAIQFVAVVMVLLIGLGAWEDLAARLEARRRAPERGSRWWRE